MMIGDRAGRLILEGEKGEGEKENGGKEKPKKRWSFGTKRGEKKKKNL